MGVSMYQSRFYGALEMADAGHGNPHEFDFLTSEWEIEIGAETRWSG
jgi:hypothetical protein